MDRRFFIKQSGFASAGAAAATRIANAADAVSPKNGALFGVKVRIARPTDKLDEVVGFYKDALGLPELSRFGPHDGYTGVLLGIPGDEIHLEFTHADQGSPCPAPTKDNLLVLYFDSPSRYEEVLTRVKSHGHASVEPMNPYWNRGRSETFEDPDGWRVVLYNGEPIGGAY